MRYLKILAVLLLSITLVACSNKSDDDESAKKKDENKTEETTTDTNKEEAEESDDESSTTEDDSESEDTTTVDDSESDDTEADEVVEESEKEYKIGDDTTPLLGQKAIEFGEELENKKPSTVTADDVLTKIPNVSNYILSNYLIMRVKDNDTANYDAIVTRSMVDEASPAKMYTEIADKQTGEFSMFSYEEEGTAYVYKDGAWTEQPLGDKEHAIYGLTNNLKATAFENKDDFQVFEDDEHYYLEYSGPLNDLTQSLSDIYNFTYQGADLDTLKFNVVYSVDKEDNTIDDVIVVSRVKGQNPSESLQIEVHADFEDYGNHPASKIEKPSGL